MLEIDAQVMAPVLADLVEQVAEQAGAGTTRVVDLGAGTGVGTVALARRLPDAEVVAVDRAPAMLARVLTAARVAGVGDRVRTLEADLGQGWPDTGEVDLVWASSSLHEVPDPAAVLRRAADVLAPGGSVAVVEMDTLPRFLPDDLGRGRPGLEVRCHDVLARAGWNSYQDWTPYLAAVGLEVSRHRHVLETQPQADLLVRYARAFLQRIRDYVGQHLPAEDLAVLDVLLGSGPESLESRGDLALQASRTLWLATRPPGVRR
ncbi:class I SAM-dependent methyltransferase [Auraticoccus monumenti]|nr:class I SAM-dependent methyltransferase [Auraticoccus monumenti]